MFIAISLIKQQKDHRFHTKLASPHNESSPAESDEKDSVFDNLIDNTLEGIRKNPLFDPLILHRNYSFDIYKIQIVPFDICLSNCFLGINDGQIYGLQSIKRIENVDLDYQDPDLIADFSVSVENVDLSMKISFTIVLLTNAEEPMEKDYNFDDESDWNNLEEEREADESSNKVIDLWLESVRRKQDGPYHLHDEYEIDVAETLMFAFDPCYKRCKIKLINGTIQGLNNITRYGNGFMDYDEADNLIVTVRLQAYNLVMEGFMSIQVAGLVLTSSAFRNIIDYQIQFLEISIGPEKDIKLRDLKVEKIEGFHVELIQQSKILRRLSEIITKNLLNSIQDQLTIVATKIFFPILLNEIKYFDEKKKTKQ
ncbi:hypothetical protein QR98_0094720 [Sarcoptes scabiei]|uniref:Uncharacterized protein n=1 Tax=Sarcoptes scabiei TaxID=52283 RepID=A0A132AJ16_SARSC|nr:hypothetical protein QR98_0094720 [Sarcoptes scabiei]